MTDFYAELIGNSFIDQVRQSLTLDKVAYANLQDILSDLAEVSKTDAMIERRVALLLYTIPQTIRNTYLSFDTPTKDMPEFVSKFEDAWIALDERVLAILAEAG